MKIFITLILALYGSTIFAEDGKLPRGTIKANPAFIPPQQATIIQSAECGEYNASPINGLNYMAPSREYIYLLVKKPTIYNGRIVTKTALFDYEFYRLSLLKFEWERLMAFSKGDISIVIPHGKYTDGVSFLTFSEFQDGCFLGNAGGFSASLEGDYKKVEQSIFGKKFAYGRYKILPSSLGRTIADMEKDTIIEVDPKIFQKRTGLKFDKKHIPVYLDYESRRLITLNQNRTPHQLELKLENAAEPYKNLPLGFNQKFVREGNQFARMHFENEGRRAIIHTTQEWTAKKENLYKLNLPDRFRAKNIAVYPRFINDTAIIMGLSLTDRKSLRAALVFDLAHDKVIHRHIPEKGFYVSYAIMGPFGKFAYFIVNHIETGTFHKLFRYDINKRYYRVLTVKTVDTAKNTVPQVQPRKVAAPTEKTPPKNTDEKTKGKKAD